jgi:hypothetical protein
MAEIAWEIVGEYAENCSCEYLCPCIFTNSKAKAVPTQAEVGEHCIAVIALQIASGHYGEVKLEGLGFVLVLKTGLVMSAGGWEVAAVVDERADAAQRAALEAIVTGKAGGALSMLAPMIQRFAPLQYGPIEFTLTHNKRTVRVPGLIEFGVEGYLSRVGNGEPFYLDNVGHPVSRRLALGTATGSHVHVGGIGWDDETRRNNGHFAPFKWSGSAAPVSYVYDRPA